jgi:diguanylate cyclase
MSENEKLLEIISNEAKDIICTMDVITPSIYASLFHQLAQSHNADIANDEELSKDLLNEKIKLAQLLQNQNIQNVNKLSIQTTNAISAIEQKDEDLLAHVLLETQSLRLEIEKLKQNMYQDELTSVYNRKWLNDTYTQEDSDILISSGTLALIDLNYFKIINDTYGHIIGDKVLVYITQQLKKTKEPIMRYGGDEFIVLFSSSTSKEDAINALNAIRETILHKQLKIKDSTFKTSFSFGVCEFKNGEVLSKIIELADKNMYYDKIQIKKRIPGI